MTKRFSFTSQFKMISSQSKSLRPRFGWLGAAESALLPSSDGEDAHREPLGSSPHRASASPSSIRGSAKSGHSLFRMAEERRARKVRFYRNGDRFFKGLQYVVSSDRFRTFESLLTALTASPMCSSKVMPSGVRYIFTLEGSRVESLEELQHGKGYVCSSTDVYRPLDYTSNQDPVWNVASNESNHATVTRKREKFRDDLKFQEYETHSTTSSHSHSHSHSRPLTQSAASTHSHTRPHSARGDKPRSSRSKSTKSEMCASELKDYQDYQRSFVTPRLITLLRNGRRPRKVFRFLLNKKTAQTFEQVMADITEVIKLDCGRVSKVYTMTGQQILCLADFFKKDTMFLACGNEKITTSDLTLDKFEHHQIKSYQPNTERARERNALHRLQKSKHAKPSLRDTNRHAHDVKDSPVIECDMKSVNKDNIDSFISKLPMPLAMTNKYEVGSLVGTGNFAVVMECKEKKTGRKFALKIINKDYCKGKEEMIDNEVRILRCVKHPNIIRLVEDYNNLHQIFYIMELVKGGDLFDAISTCNTKFSEQDASDMLYNLTSALQYLHAMSIVHRDVKPENILIKQHEDGTKSLKLGDFGLAAEVRGPLFAVCGTPTYVAPEVIAETGYGLKIDVWSAGVIAYILLCGYPPFASPTDDQDELFDMIMGGTYDYPSPYWDDISSTAKNVISAMLEVNPELRLSAAQVLEHKWIACDTQSNGELQKNATRGHGSTFRREPRPAHNYNGIRCAANTAMDKASKFFRSRGSMNSGHSHPRPKEI